MKVSAGTRQGHGLSMAVEGRDLCAEVEKLGLWGKMRWWILEKQDSRAAWWSGVQV